MSARAPSTSRGFTLIEITIVLALVALLLTIAVPRYFHSIDAGKLQVQRQNLAAIRDALDKFRGDQGKYPDELDDLVKKKYLRAIPVDPATQLPNWTVIAPEEEAQGRVYDVRSATQAADGTVDPAQAAGAPRDGSASSASASAPSGASAPGSSTSLQPLPGQGRQDGR